MRSSALSVVSIGRISSPSSAPSTRTSGIVGDATASSVTHEASLPLSPAVPAALPDTLLLVNLEAAAEAAEAVPS